MKFVPWNKDIASTYYRCFVSVAPTRDAINIIASRTRSPPSIDIKKWCKENLTGKIMVPYHEAHYFFEVIEDAVAFKLRWM